ncbi:hypothetical protein TSOC_010179 [Tetrabaena socialis]|uniref:Uncharacterized protein n=1 Tax=Tetrabaena socialis TaxID=47790 RepID=A0A2J7ZU19_9CHLO|nr:hypothetical protein TSOC_010179 [Tetrabaena socialis]|eukprot:PNH03730.1 hypothetical protein TSOC_010179 [Tetrabaena socialis]
MSAAGQPKKLLLAARLRSQQRNGTTPLRPDALRPPGHGRSDFNHPCGWNVKQEDADKAPDAWSFNSFDNGTRCLVLWSF